MKINYTPAQQSAIDTRDKALLLSAAAGSGKTAVLVARILDIISNEENDINITDLLIVTFTNLAAAQMKERIYKEVSARIKENPQNRKLKKQLVLLSGAKIKTIHSFCLDIIKENIDLTDIPVNFRVAEENETETVKLSVLNEFIEEKYKEYNTAFLDIMNTYAYSRDDTAFTELMLDFSKTMESIPEKEKYLEMCVQNLETAVESFPESIYAQIIKNHICSILKDVIKRYDVAINEAELSPDFDHYSPFFQEERLFINSLCEIESIEKLKEKTDEYNFPTLPRKKSGTDNSLFKEIRASFKDKAYKNISKILNSDINNECKEQESILIRFKEIIELWQEFSEKFEAEKKKRAILTFSDFEHLAYKLLKNPDGTQSNLSLSIQDSFYEILIDEYQDTSDIQNSIFEYISDGGKNLFMVGDVKQSIYKFRHAKPELFIKKANDFEKDGEKSQLIMLSENFRSRCQVIDSVNCIFEDIMTEESSMTDYKKESLKLGRTIPEAEETDYKTEVLLFSGQHSDDDDELGSNEGNLIASRINELINEEFPIYNEKTGEHRKIEYGDIVILVRDMRAKARCIYNSLLEKGIPVSGEFEGGFYNRPEIMCLINILSAIDNPYNDFYLLSLLKSPPFHFTEDELLTLRSIDDKVPFFEVLKQSETEKAKKVVKFLKELSLFSGTNNISDIVWEVYKKLELYERFSAFKNYEQRLYHLDLFYKTACEYEKNQNGGLKSFLNYMEKASKTPKKVKNIYEDKNENSVKILTMHKSKGLEFPVVFVSGLGKSLKGKDSTKKILMHPEIGIGADYISKDDMYITKTMCKNAVKIKQEYEQISEELRILYVALTRAKEKLILTANISKYDKRAVLWETIKICGGHTLTSLMENATFIDWVMPSIIDSHLFSQKVFDELPGFTGNEINIDEEETTVNESAFFEYPNIEKTGLPLKVTVSQANRINNEESENYKTKFTLMDLDSTEDKISGAEYGTYFHKVFELCDIDDIKNNKSVKAVINDLITSQMLMEMPYTDEVVKNVEGFFESSLGQELLKSDAVYKETPFLVRIPAPKILDTEYNDDMLLQGTTDCYFETNNGITLLDFKTDKNSDEDKIRENYSKQIELYAYALEKITEKKVTRKVIYTVRNSKIIEF